MSNAKYDWSAHMPAIVALYLEGHSIPKIHEAIQNESPGFTPSLRVLYSTLKSSGYPTDPAGRAKRMSSLNIARWPSEVLSQTLISENQHPQSASSFQHNQFPRNKSNVQSSPQSTKLRLDQQNSTQQPFSSTMMHWNAGQSPYLNWRGLTPITENDQPLDSPPFISHQDPTSSWLEHHDMACFQEQSDPASEIGGTESFLDLSWDTMDFPSGASEIPLLSATESGKQTEVGSSFAAQGIESEARDVAQREHISHEASAAIPNAPSPFAQRSPPINALSSQHIAKNSFGDRFLPIRKLKTWNNRSPTPEKRHSSATTDSGYASGRNSPFNLLTEGEQFHPQSLTEFKGLYRVPCYDLHEPRSYNEYYMPQPTARFKEIDQCTHCKYSGIHNLSWSATQLKLEVFMAELRLDAIYDFSDLDAAGNSALHYAAAGGATYEHLNALIKAGVNPNQLNTCGQLFLHCMRPKLKSLGDDSADPHLLTAFKLDLVNLLNQFRNTGAFRWHDNKGMTAVDSLALHINDAEATRQIFRAVINAGHPLEVSPRFKKAPRIKTTKGQATSPLSTPSFDSQEHESPPTVLFDKIAERQKKAWDILRLASAEPSYVDPETGDNALHALSCVRFPQTGSHMKILSSLRAFVSQDVVDLNLQNREQESPLTSIICHRPVHGIENDETGATMSKYLDALLWKNALKRTPNKINVNMQNRKGATALYYAATLGRPDSVRSLIEAGANVNVRLRVDGYPISILQATLNAKAKALGKSPDDALTDHLYNNVLSYLEHANAVADPSLLYERRVSDNSTRMMPM